MTISNLMDYSFNNYGNKLSTLELRELENNLVDQNLTSTTLQTQEQNVDSGGIGGYIISLGELLSLSGLASKAPPSKQSSLGL